MRKCKRKHEKRKGMNCKLCWKMAIVIPSLLCLFIGCFFAYMSDYDSTIDSRVAEAYLARVAGIPQAQRERMPESEIEYENFKQLLFAIVDNAVIHPRYDSHSIYKGEPPYTDASPLLYCIVGISNNLVGADISFTEVIQRYGAWAEENGWYYEVNETDIERPDHSFKSRIYRDLGNVLERQTQFEIEPISVDPSSSTFERGYISHYRLNLRYVDHSCDEDW